MRLNIFRRKRKSTSRLAELAEQLERLKVEKRKVHERMVEAAEEYKKALRGEA